MLFSKKLGNPAFKFRRLLPGHNVRSFQHVTHGPALFLAKNRERVGYPEIPVFLCHRRENNTMPLFLKTVRPAPSQEGAQISPRLSLQCGGTDERASGVEWYRADAIGEDRGYTKALNRGKTISNTRYRRCISEI